MSKYQILPNIKGKESKKAYKIYRIYNFHRDNWKTILAALFTNYIYACFTIGVPVAIVIGKLWIVSLALLGAYTMLTIIINRPRYETIYGKILMIIACTLGGITSYIGGEFFKTYFLN